MLQVQADWVKGGTAKDLEQHIVDFKFRGTGLYLFPTETYLVMPVMDQMKDLWKVQWPEDTIFRIYYYGTHYSNTILGARINVRVDET